MCESKQCPTKQTPRWRLFNEVSDKCTRVEFEEQKYFLEHCSPQETMFITSRHCLSIKDEDLIFLHTLPREQTSRVHTLYLECPEVTDVIGVLIADIVEHSDCIVSVRIVSERITEATCSAMAMALRKNKSLHYLAICNPAEKFDYSKVVQMFAEALKENPDRPPHSTWSFTTPDFHGQRAFDDVQSMAHVNCGPTRRADTLVRRIPTVSQKKPRRELKPTKTIYERLRGAFCR